MSNLQKQIQQNPHLSKMFDKALKEEGDRILLQAGYMSWQPFTPDIKERGKMLFLDKEGHWFEGSLVDDSEYGTCIALWETYSTLDGITHYMIIKVPNEISV